MTKKHIITLLSITASMLIASCIGFLAWKILELVYPHKNILELSLDAIEPDYDLPRWAVGSIAFGLLYLIISHLWDNALKAMEIQKTDFVLKSKMLWVSVLPSRIVLSLFLISFWSNYVSYQWFSNISIMIGDFKNDFLVRLLCIIVPSLLGIYIITIEPWQKLITFTSSRFFGTVGRIVSIIFISVNFYLLSITKFPSNITIPILIALSFLIAFVVLMATLQGHTIKEQT
jgi:hypothetical protein